MMLLVDSFAKMILLADVFVSQIKVSLLRYLHA